MIHPKATHLVRGYSSNGGALLLETWHIGESSMQTEVEAWKRRMRKAEVAYVEVVDLKKQAKPTTIYPERP